MLVKKDNVQLTIALPFYIPVVCKQKTRVFKKTVLFIRNPGFQKTVLFIKNPGFQKTALFIKNSVFTLYGSGPVFQKTVLFYQRTEFSLKFRVFFKTSVFLKIPRSKDRPFYQRTEFSLKFRVFSKLPCF